MTSIRIDDAELSRGLAELQTRLVRLRPVLNDIGEQLLNSTRERFRSESAPDGSKWTPLSRRYAARKARKGRSKTLLQLNGYLFGSLTYQASDTEVRVGTNRPYARVHQFGGAIAVSPRSGSLKLRTDARGNLLKRGNLAVIANRRNKRFTVRDYVRSGFVVNIPARPFLGISQDDRVSIRLTVARYLEGN